MKYKNDDPIYYQNIPAIFVAYLTCETAVIIVETVPDFDATADAVSGTCQGCMVGDSDNKLSCTCEDTEYLLEILENNTDPTKIPLLVSTKMIYDKPIEVIRHELDLAEIELKRDVVVQEIKKLKGENKAMIESKNTLTKTVAELEQRATNYAELGEELTIESFCYRMANNMANMLNSENDSRKVVGGNDDREFKFNGLFYEIKVVAFWEKSDYFNYEVEGIGFEFKLSGNSI